ncbi:MAG: hypothetical protein JW829_01630 [Pirellulales bacterium]|nr:hypothetical protein [Pirellulales bacterium]
MMDTNDQRTEVDPPDCLACPRRECSGHIPVENNSLQGCRFVSASLGLFLTPIVLAIAGSLLGGNEPGTQFVGGIVGFLLGMGGAVAVGRWRRREPE